MKNPIALAVINFLTIGLGTLLLGKRPLVGLLLLAGGSLLRYEELKIAPLITGALSVDWIVAFLGMGALGLGTALDVHREAKAG